MGSGRLEVAGAQLRDCVQEHKCNLSCKQGASRALHWQPVQWGPRTAPVKESSTNSWLPAAAHRRMPSTVKRTPVSGAAELTTSGICSAQAHVSAAQMTAAQAGRQLSAP